MIVLGGHVNCNFVDFIQESTPPLLCLGEPRRMSCSLDSSLVTSMVEHVPGNLWQQRQQGQVHPIRYIIYLLLEHTFVYTYVLQQHQLYVLIYIYMKTKKTKSNKTHTFLCLFSGCHSPGSS